MPITTVTRNAICDGLRIRGTVWSGRFDQREFLSRLYNLDELPSNDPRFRTAARDIACHTISFPGDWPPLWVFDDARFELAWNDDKLLVFLAEMLHPEVRPDTDEVHELVAFLNTNLQKDGWQLIETARISDRPVFKAHPAGHINTIAPVIDVLDSAYVQRQIMRMLGSIEKDPELAIGSAKELIETSCKTVLAKLGVPIEDDLPGLVRRALDTLGVDVFEADEPVRAERAVKRLLGALSGIGSAIAEVRNAVGTGHGRDASVGDLSPMYARLAVNATAALVTFMMDRYRTVAEEQKAAALLAGMLGVKPEEVTPELVKAKAEEVKAQHFVIPLTEVTTSNDLAAVFDAVALHFECESSKDHVLDAGAELQQLILDALNLRGELGPTQKREYVKDVFDVVERLRSLTCSVSLGIHRHSLRRQGGELMPWSTLYVVVTPSDQTKKSVLVRKGQAIRFET